MDSILESIRKFIGCNDETFDADLIMHINTALYRLRTLGVGPETGFVIHDSGEIWSDFIGNTILLESVKTYVYLKTKLLFDPASIPPSVITAINEQLRELEFLLVT